MLMDLLLICQFNCHVHAGSKISTSLFLKGEFKLNGNCIAYLLSILFYVNVDSHITATNIEDRLAMALEKATETLNVLSIQR